MGQPIMPKRKVPATSKLQEVTDPLYGESNRAATRAEMRRNSEENVNAINVHEVVENLLEVIGSTDITNPNAGIAPYEIDQLAAELISVRNAKDMVEGREAALKGYASDVINARIASLGKDPLSESGYLVSPENGVKLSKEVTGGKLTVDIDLLESILDRAQFESITNHITIEKVVVTPDQKVTTSVEDYRELNDEALEKELKMGNIGMEEIIKATIPGKVRSAFYVRTL